MISLFIYLFIYLFKLQSCYIITELLPLYPIYLFVYIYLFYIFYISYRYFLHCSDFVIERYCIQVYKKQILSVSKFIRKQIFCLKNSKHPGAQTEGLLFLSDILYMCSLYLGLQKYVQKLRGSFKYRVQECPLIHTESWCIHLLFYKQSKI